MDIVFLNNYQEWTKRLKTPYLNGIEIRDKEFIMKYISHWKKIEK